jgi:hypothetical protein
MTEDELTTSLDSISRRGPSAEHDAAVRRVIDATGNRIRRRRWIPLAAAASLFLAVGLGFFALPGIENSAPLMRNAADTASPSGYETLAAPPRSLQWIDDREDAPYRIEMFDRSGTELWEVNDVAASNLTLSEHNLTSIETAGIYYWVVTTADGAELGPYWFRIDRR